MTRSLARPSVGGGLTLTVKLPSEFVSTLSNFDPGFTFTIIFAIAKIVTPLLVCCKLGSHRNCDPAIGKLSRKPYLKATSTTNASFTAI